MKHFKQTFGKYIEYLSGQDRFAFALTEHIDFFMVDDWLKQGGHPGNQLIIYDFVKEELYMPFEQERNVIYSRPHFVNGFIYFLRGEFNQRVFELYRYLPESTLEKIHQFQAHEVDSYNLHLMGEGLHVTSQRVGEEFCCYYPEKFSIPLKQNETVGYLDDDKIYVEAWVEEGWDDEKNCATEEYIYYDKVIIKDRKGHILSEEIGCLFQAQDGNWWIV